MDQAEFDRFAEEYEIQLRANISASGEGPEFFAEYKIREFAGFAAPLGREGAEILDFGSGIGASVPFLRGYFKGAHVTCADPSTRSLEISRGRFPGPERYCVIDGKRIDQAQDSFDLCFSACVFHHIPHAEHGLWLGELYRVTRSGGLLTIFEHNPLNPLTVRVVNTCPFDVNAVLLRASSLRTSMEKAGWVETTIRYHVFFPHALSALRPLEKHLQSLPLGAQYSITARKP
jgi:ubiquinone/menaquinone biosynthesis C-methylase UbiE